MTLIVITTGTYGCSDYRIVKTYVCEKAALKFLKKIGYAYDRFYNTAWNHYGKQYTLLIY